MSKVDKISFCHCCLIPKPCCDNVPFCYDTCLLPMFCLPCTYMSFNNFTQSLITDCDEDLDIDDIQLTSKEDDDMDDCNFYTLICCPLKTIVLFPFFPCICYSPPWHEENINN